MAWPRTSRITSVIAFTPLHQFNPKAKGGSGSWQKYYSHTTKGQKRDLFYKDKNLWFYLGIFECLSVGSIALEGVRGLDRVVGFFGRFYMTVILTVIFQVEEALYNRTILSHDLVPPIVRKMVPNMYTVGALQVHYLSLRCVGFNQELYSSLNSDAPKPPGLTQRPGAPSGGKKRPASGKSQQNSKKSKR